MFIHLSLSITQFMRTNVFIIGYLPYLLTNTISTAEDGATRFNARRSPHRHAYAWLLPWIWLDMQNPSLRGDWLSFGGYFPCGIFISYLTLLSARLSHTYRRIQYRMNYLRNLSITAAAIFDSHDHIISKESSQSDELFTYA
jgi:hypothetical protein